MEIQWHLKHWDNLSANELYEMLALRIRVFVIEQNCPYQDADGKDKQSYHLFATDENGECLACLRIVKPGVSYKEWSIGRVATDIRTRRSGLGKEMMIQAMDWLRKEQSNPSVRISAQSYLEGFYKSFDFVPTGKAYLEDNIPHLEMLHSSQP